jgi:glucoamylase
VSDLRSPAGARDETGRRIRSLAAAVVGNGSLLATFSARGEIERLFWPNVDWGQHLGELRLGLTGTSATDWLDEAQDDAYTQRYLDDANVLITIGPAAEVLDFAVPGEPVLLRRVRPRSESRLAVYCRPKLDEAAKYGCVYVHPASHALVFYRRDRALAIGLSGGFTATCGGAESGRVLEEIAAGDLGRRTIDHGEVDGALLADAPGEAWLAGAFGSSPQDAVGLLEQTLARNPTALLEERIRYDGERLAGAPAPSDVEGLHELFRRSLLVFDLVSDRSTGGVVAAPEFDSMLPGSGGYGFVWGRDLAYIVLGFLAGGRDDLARRAVGWLVRTQTAEGLWLQRHWTDGSLAPSWGLHQVDETGSILFALEAAARELGDDELVWPAVHRGAEFLLKFRDPETGLARPSVDLWEEREGQHAYTAAAVYGGLCAAASMAGRVDAERAAEFADGARSVQAAIEEHLWSEEHGRYLRSRNVGREEGEGPTPPLFESGLPYPNRAVHSVDPVDPIVDVSLLGLSWPFGAVPADSPRMRATADAVVEALTLPSGGVMRYDGDVYAGGNAWILTTLWLGLYKRSAGDAAALRRALEFAVSRQTRVGLLPEQVREDGEPAWVVPLTWSHAMLAVAARPELHVVRAAANGGLVATP